VPLHGGTVNQVYRVRSSLGLFVVRLGEPASELMGVDRKREAVLHAAASRAGLAPVLVAVDERNRFLVTEYIEGTGCRPEHMADRVFLRQLARWLRALHSLEAPDVHPMDMAELLRSHYERIVRVDRTDASRLEGWVRRAEGMLSTCASATRGQCIVHGDPHHSNMITADRLYLVDWEYAAVADPLFDLACLLAYYPAVEPHVPLLLEETGLGAVADREALTEAAWFFVLLSYLWYRARRLDVPAGASDLAAEKRLLERL
jgi:aminoglycoside phosphotransferase (APT) family kinase protein